MKMTKAKANRVRWAIRNGLSNADIKTKFGITSHSLYMIRYRLRKQLGGAPLPVLSPTTTTTSQVIIAAPDSVQVGGDHYKDHKIQVWDAIHDWGLGYFSGNVIKYVARHQKKNGVEDLKEARRYLDKLIAMSEKQGK